MVEHGTIIQSFRGVGALLAKVTGKCEDLPDRRTQQCFHGGALAPCPGGQGESRSGGPGHIDQGNVDVVLVIRKALARFIVTGRFHDAITAFTKIFCERMPDEHVLLDDQNCCCLHAAYSAGPSISVISIAIERGS